MDEPMIRIRELVKTFGPRRALRGINLDVAAGQCLVVVGPNGAGKTTLLRVLATLARPTSGQVIIDGLDLAHQADTVRRRIGFVSHQSLLYGDLSAEENLTFYGRMYGIADLNQRVTAMLEDVGLAPRRYDRVRTFSRGMRQRLSIARALLHQPRLLLMDEPYTGLDQQAAEALDRILTGSETQRPTIVMATHDLDGGLAMAQEVLILSDGAMVHHMARKDWDLQGFRRLYRKTLAQSRS
jgi:heme exporter protein A